MPQIIIEKPLNRWLDIGQSDMTDEGDFFQPEHPDELIGMEVVYRHPQCEERCTGEVVDWMHYRGSLYLFVQQHERNVNKWIHESAFICYGWELPTLKQWEAETARLAISA